MIAFALLLPIRGLRSTRLGVMRRDLRGEAQVTPPLHCTASHKIVRSCLGMYCGSCGETRNFKTTCSAAEHEAALELLKIDAAATGRYALELFKIDAAAKEGQAQREADANNIRSQNLTVLTFCLIVLFVSFFSSSEGASWVTKTVVPLLNGAWKKLSGAAGAVLGFVVGRDRDWHPLLRHP